MKCCGRSLKTRVDAARKSNLLLDFFDRVGRVTQRNLRSEIEGQSHNRELSLMINGQRSIDLLEVRERSQRNLLPSARFHVDVFQVLRIDLRLGINLQHHVILIELSEHRRDLSLSECVVECVVDVLRKNAEPRSCIAVNHEVRFKSIILLIAGYVTQFGNGL